MLTIELSLDDLNFFSGVMPSVLEICVTFSRTYHWLLESEKRHNSRIAAKLNVIT